MMFHFITKFVVYVGKWFVLCLQRAFMYLFV